MASSSTVEKKQPEMKSSLTAGNKLSEKENISAETEIALQDAIADSANETLALRTTSEIKELEQANIENLPSGKELAAKLNNSSLSTDKPSHWKTRSKVRIQCLQIRLWLQPFPYRLPASADCNLGPLQEGVVRR